MTYDEHHARALYLMRDAVAPRCTRCRQEPAHGSTWDGLCDTCREGLAREAEAQRESERWGQGNELARDAAAEMEEP